MLFKDSGARDSHQCGSQTLTSAEEINQIKVAAETGFRYKGKQFEDLNKLIDDYSKDNKIDLRKKVLPSAEHLKKYKEQGKEAREYYLKTHPQAKTNETKKS